MPKLIKVEHNFEQKMIIKKNGAFLRLTVYFSTPYFRTAGPRVWSNLLTDLGQLDLSHSRFGQTLKTFLFGPASTCVIALQKRGYLITSGKRL